MKGIVTVDDIVDVVQEEATEDIQKIGGMRGPRRAVPRRSASATWSASAAAGWRCSSSARCSPPPRWATSRTRSRAPSCSRSSCRSSSRSGGNSGSQASTLVIRAMALGEVRLRDWWRVVRRELVDRPRARAACSALIGFLRILVWQAVVRRLRRALPADRRSPSPAACVGVVMFGTLAGSMLPFLLRRLGLRPGERVGAVRRHAGRRDRARHLLHGGEADPGRHACCSQLSAGAQALAAILLSAFTLLIRYGLGRPCDTRLLRSSPRDEPAMKARQIAASFQQRLRHRPSDDQVRLIERGPDGLWGRWRDRGSRRPSRSSMAGSVVATIGPDDRVSVLRAQAGRHLVRPGTARLDEVSVDPRARTQGPVLFAADQRSGLVRLGRRRRTAPWRDWSAARGPSSAARGDGHSRRRSRDRSGIRDGDGLPPLAGPAARGLGASGLPRRAAGRRAIGACARPSATAAWSIFAVGGDGAVHHRWQDKPFGPWHPWESLGGAVRSVVGRQVATGGLAVFAVGADDAGARTGTSRAPSARGAPGSRSAWTVTEPRGPGELYRRPGGVRDRASTARCTTPGASGSTRPGRPGPRSTTSSRRSAGRVARCRWAARPRAPAARSSSCPSAGSRSARPAGPAARPRRS